MGVVSYPKVERSVTQLWHGFVGLRYR